MSRLSERGERVLNHLLTVMADGQWRTTRELCDTMPDEHSKRTVHRTARHCESCRCWVAVEEDYTIRGMGWYSHVYNSLGRLYRRGVVQRRHDSGWSSVRWRMSVLQDLDAELAALLGGGA